MFSTYRATIRIRLLNCWAPNREIISILIAWSTKIIFCQRAAARGNRGKSCKSTKTNRKKRNKQHDRFRDPFSLRRRTILALLQPFLLPFLSPPRPNESKCNDDNTDLFVPRDTVLTERSFPRVARAALKNRTLALASKEIIFYFELGSSSRKYLAMYLAKPSVNGISPECNWSHNKNVREGWI